MHLYELHFCQFSHQPLEQVFSFFQDQKIWSSLISLYDPPNMFVDKQIRGPFSLWHHTHTFREKNDGTVIGGHVRYAIPMANNLFVEKDLLHISRYRQKMISKLFPKYH